ncbi:unnamed protein product [Clavelina lepadiformis]|uniref:Uncharacterized protein n=1 Tax=Clavelina lepadiformis TaxID=159417 RepID=A0ABP0FXT9_CLALP
MDTHWDTGTGCLRPITLDNLPFFGGIQPAGLHHDRATLARRATEPLHLLHWKLFCSSKRASLTTEIKTTICSGHTVTAIEQAKNSGDVISDCSIAHAPHGLYGLDASFG